MDVAASEFYKEDAKKYDLDFKNAESDPSKWLTGEQLGDLYKSFMKVQRLTWECEWQW